MLTHLGEWHYCSPVGCHAKRPPYYRLTTEPYLIGLLCELFELAEASGALMVNNGMGLGDQEPWTLLNRKGGRIGDKLSLPFPEGAAGGAGDGGDGDDGGELDEEVLGWPPEELMLVGQPTREEKMDYISSLQ